MSNTSVPLYRRAEDCPDAEKRHTPCPRDYLAWHEWAEKKAKTHVQERCPVCGFYAIWKPKPKKRAAGGA